MFHLEKRNRDLWNGNTLFDKDFDKLFDVFSRAQENFHAPACEITEEEKRYAVSVDVPGMREEDITIEVKDNHLYVSGERKYENKSEKNNVLRTERKYGKFSRVFTLPQDVDAGGIEASFENGVLEMSIPKSEKAQARKISIAPKSKAIEGELKN